MQHSKPVCLQIQRVCHNPCPINLLHRLGMLLRIPTHWQAGRHEPAALGTGYSVLLALLVCLLTVDVTQSLHLTGTFHNKDFFRFLAKFGFQKVDRNNLDNTTGYIYGTLKSNNLNSSSNHDLYLVVVDSHYFLQYYAKRTDNSSERCTNMFSEIDTIAWDKYCFPAGQEDFLRRIPCPEGHLCTEELQDPSAVIDNKQFTYHIVDLKQPR